MDVPTVRWLASADGAAVLQSLPPWDESGVLALNARLRAGGLDPERTAAVLTQHRLRARARAKFGEQAATMLFTADGLEQASRAEVAAVHAQRFAAVDPAVVHDLGCGIGADAMAIAAAGSAVHAVDADPVTAALAHANLRPWPRACARPGRAEDLVVPGGRERVGVWFDPARRVPGLADVHGRPHRLSRLEDLSPPWAFVEQVAAQVPATGAKLGPGFPHARIPAGAQAQWTSWDGGLVECVIWWGPLAHSPGRSALVLAPGRAPVEVLASAADPDPPRATGLDDVAAWLHEPDRAVTAAGLVGAATAALSGVEVDEGAGYVLTDSTLALPFTRRYAVREAMPYHPGSLRGWLRERGITGLTIKQRGVRLDEDAVRRALRVGRGAGAGEQATVVLTRIAGRRVVLVVEPAAPAAGA